jgi:hypothetical protein
LAKPVQQKLGSRIFSGPPAPAPHAHNADPLSYGATANGPHLSGKPFKDGSAENAATFSQILNNFKLSEAWLKLLKDA